MKIREIWRYPVKSLSGAAVERTVLNPGQGLPFDRRWALALQDTQAAQGTEWQPKSQFAVQVKEHAMAALSCTFDERTGLFGVKGPGALHVEANLMAPDGRTAIAGAVGDHLGLGEQETPVMVEAREIGYFDSLKGPVSILNMASLKALEDATGQTVEPQRFRMNFWIEDCPAWDEMAWVDKRLQIGQARLRVTKQTGRCKATHVNPSSGTLDVKVLHALKDHFGHTNMGVYAVVEDGGPVHVGDTLKVLD